MAKQEYEGIAFTAMVSPSGVLIHPTARADSVSDAVDELELEVVNMLERGYTPFWSYSNKYEPVHELGQAPVITEQSLATDPFPDVSVVDTAVNLGAVEVDPFDAAPELVPFLKKAGEWKTGDVQEVLVDQYTLADGKIAFYKEGNEYPLHTHYLNDIGVKVMAQVFGDEWDRSFGVTAEKAPFLGGAYIIAIKGGKERTSGQGAGNVFRNFTSGRRP